MVKLLLLDDFNARVKGDVEPWSGSICKKRAEKIDF